MIDENCVIWKQHKGLCWCPSSAWGLNDQELCQLCQIKNAEIIEKIEIINPKLPKVGLPDSRRPCPTPNNEPIFAGPGTGK
jgi:hypothetical protein